MPKDKQDNNLLGAYSAMNRQIGRGKIKIVTRHEMQDLVVIDGKGEELLLVI
jgi:succinate dehydrogenase / fumarate reductase flavoprotein subunit